MSYSFSSRVRYHETDYNGRLTLTGLINYFQDCSGFHSEDIGQGFRVLRSRNLAWVVTSWQVFIDRLPMLGEEILVSTSPYEFRGYFGSREYSLSDSSGKHLCMANSFWVNVNLSTQAPQRLTPEDVKGYELDPRLGVSFPPRKIALPQDWEKQEPFEINKHHLDTNQHVNNCQYVSMAEDFLPDGFQVHGLRVEYKQQGLLGDIFYPFVHQEEGKTIVLFNQKENPQELLPYAVVEMSEARGSGF